jgi:hypothetical protein
VGVTVFDVKLEQTLSLTFVHSIEGVMNVRITPAPAAKVATNTDVCFWEKYIEKA